MMESKQEVDKDNTENHEHSKVDSGGYTTNYGAPEILPSSITNAEFSYPAGHLINSYAERLKREFLDTLDEDESLNDCHSVGTEGSDYASLSQLPSSRNLNVGYRRAPSRMSIFSDPIDVTHKSIRVEDTGELFAQKIQIRPKHQMRPSSRRFSFLPKLRMIRTVLFNPFISLRNFPDADSKEVAQAADTFGEDGIGIERKKQYTVTVKREISTLKKILYLMSPDEYSYSPNQLVLAYINASFRANFITVVMSFTLLYLIMCLIFAVFIMIAGDANPNCIRIGGTEYGTETSTTFSDSFHLSWTTFTTVGYGAAYPATGTEHAEQGECIFVKLLCTLESFIGLLYAGFCTAILFGKVARVQSHAQVSFSNALCIQYGENIWNNEKDNSIRKLDAWNNQFNRNEGDSIRKITEIQHIQQVTPWIILRTSNISSIMNFKLIIVSMCFVPSYFRKSRQIQK